MRYRRTYVAGYTATLVLASARIGILAELAMIGFFLESQEFLMLMPGRMAYYVSSSAASAVGAFVAGALVP